MSHAVQSEKPNISSSAALWAVLIFVGLLIGAINFVKVMGEDDGTHGGGHGAPAAQHGGSHTESAPAHDNSGSTQGHEETPAQEEGHH